MIIFYDHYLYFSLIINGPNAILKDKIVAPLSSDQKLAYLSSYSDQGIKLAITTQRLSGDNWPRNGSSKFSGAVSRWPTFLYMVRAVIDT